jgi:hypothetical protein
MVGWRQSAYLEGGGMEAVDVVSLLEVVGWKLVIESAYLEGGRIEADADN